MPCKHEGGTEECHRYKGGKCKTLVAEYNKHKNSSPIGRSGTGDIGYAGELIVRTDLLLRGLTVTIPENRSTPDDLHFKSEKGWVSVQVKTAIVNNKTGTWTLSLRGTGATSDILAWVDIQNRKLRYAPNTKPVPPELLT